MTTQTVAQGGTGDPVTLDESVTMAFLVVLESMTPAERVTLILHDFSGYTLAEVARITGRTPGACRQLESSARRRIRTSQVPRAPSAGQADLVRDFGQAWAAGDIDALAGLLDPCATAVADGAGLVSAVLAPIEGDEQIAHYLVDLVGTAPSLTIEESTVNGRPGLVARQDGATVTALAFDIEGGWITRIWAVGDTVAIREAPDAPRQRVGV